MTETLKVEVDEALAKRFRKKAMEKYGYKKGAVKNALVDLMTKFASPTRSADWIFIVGSLKNEYKGMSSVELQHSLWRRKVDSHRH
jgi:hypothetical protein